MIPDFVWPFVAIGCLLGLAWLDTRRITGRGNRQAIENERVARERGGMA